jgi:dTDP-4-dehydrorhamnose 3,5-epimerase
MKIIETKIQGLLIIEPKIFSDDRGYFYETFQAKRYKDAGIDADFIQDNEAFSGYGVVRGLHYQLAPYAQAKLVRVIQGVVLDIAVDIRKGSPTFGQWVGLELSETNKCQFYIPRGFAHGYSVISKTAIFSYKCDNQYHPQSERGINIKDTSLNLDWKLPENEMIISSKDTVLPNLEKAEMNFTYGKEI